jgi:hypothetical protein
MYQVLKYEDAEPKAMQDRVKFYSPVTTQLCRQCYKVIDYAGR